MTESESPETVSRLARLTKVLAPVRANLGTAGILTVVVVLTGLAASAALFRTASRHSEKMARYDLPMSTLLSAVETTHQHLQSVASDILGDPPEADEPAVALWYQTRLSELKSCIERGDQSLTKAKRLARGAAGDWPEYETRERQLRRLVDHHAKLSTDVEVLSHLTSKSRLDSEPVWARTVRNDMKAFGTELSRVTVELRRSATVSSRLVRSCALRHLMNWTLLTLFAAGCGIAGYREKRRPTPAEWKPTDTPAKEVAEVAADVPGELVGASK